MAIKNWKKKKVIGKDLFERNDKRFVIQIRNEVRGCSSNEPYRVDLIDKESEHIDGIGFDQAKKCAKTKSDALKIAKEWMKEY